MAGGEESWCCSFFLHACALNNSYGVSLYSYVLVWRVLLILLIFLLCACACSVGHGVAFSSYMLACMHDVDHGVALCCLMFVHTMVVMELSSPHSNITTLLLCALCLCEWL